jgi:hypothetical protein
MGPMYVVIEQVNKARPLYGLNTFSPQRACLTPLALPKKSCCLWVHCSVKCTVQCVFYIGEEFMRGLLCICDFKGWLVNVEILLTNKLYRHQSKMSSSKKIYL